MDAGQFFRGRQSVSHELFVDGQDLAFAADHPQIREGCIDHLTQHHRVMPVAAGHDHKVRIRRLRPVADRLDDIPYQEVLHIRQALRIAQGRTVIDDGHLESAAGCVVA